MVQLVPGNSRFRIALLGPLRALLIRRRRQALLAREVDAAVAVEVELEAGGQSGLVVRRAAAVRLGGHFVVERGELMDEGPGLVLGEGALNESRMLLRVTHCSGQEHWWKASRTSWWPGSFSGL